MIRFLRITSVKVTEKDGSTTDELFKPDEWLQAEAVSEQPAYDFVTLRFPDGAEARGVHRAFFEVSD